MASTSKHCHFYVKFASFLLSMLVLVCDFQNAQAKAPNDAKDVPILRSCYELKLAGYSMDGEYSIDPDGHGKGEEPFTVLCEMSTGTSIVYHDKQNRALVPRGYEDRGNFRAPVTYYGATIEQLANLADVSGNCSQFISLECTHVLMWWKDDAWTYWVSRDGEEMNNWGSPTGTNGCHCSVDGGCDGGQRRCSCDVNDDRWRMDRGYLRDKNYLPVKEMRFGDSQGTEELAIYRLGALKCRGQDIPLYSSCSAIIEAGYSGGKYLIDESSEEGGTVAVVECDDRKDHPGEPPILKSCAALREAGYRRDGVYEIDPDGYGVGVIPFSVQCYLSSGLTPPIMKSCADLHVAGYSINKEYLIDPDGPDNGVEPFAVFCDLSTGTSIIHHDQLPLRQVPFGFEEDGEYHIPIRYNTEFHQIVALIESSLKCRQYLSLECHHVLIWHNEELINWWVSRDGNKMGNWASPTGTRGCACKLSNSCFRDSDRRCNCDANDFVWRKDDGYITDRSTLPIIELRLSDTGQPPESVFYTVGPLTCSGFDPSTRVSSKDEGKPLTPKDDRPSSNPSLNPPVINKGASSSTHESNASCSNKSAHTGLVVGIILMIIVILILLVIVIFLWRNRTSHLKHSGYRGGVI
ncbi:uncharacterized protein [Amphiura filiformis]|uniref:uncharacterized protein n=1 Tax=Amphiura filiformis TaxID=82378 RepID=UPI003B20E1DE